MTTPDTIECGLTLRTAAVRLDELRMRRASALSEVLIRKALHGRQLDVRAARSAGASWTQIGAAVGVSKQAAWEAHDRWINGQAELHWDAEHEGLDVSEVHRARAVAGGPRD